MSVSFRQATEALFEKKKRKARKKEGEIEA